MRRGLLIALLALLAAPLLAAGFMAYPPVRPRWEAPAPPYEDVVFASDRDGARLSGWYLPAPAGTGDRCIIIVHGFLNDRLVHGRGLPLTEALREQGFSVLLFDLRGQGESGGGPVTFGAREPWDVAGAVRYVRSRGAEHVGLLGYSIGAVAALLAAAADPAIEAVVADSAWADLPALYRYLTLADERKVRPAAAVSGLGARPLLLIHGTADRVIPVAESEKLMAAAAGNPLAELWVVPGARHTHSYEADPAAYIQRVVGFLNSSVRALTPMPKKA
ncbi:MAG TPA: alpha/beta hydrolase [Symbiobacteriaceae bacterium]|nr:alpha/beta hydrolase [Symbiobacteriaceae bacterium]